MLDGECTEGVVGGVEDVSHGPDPPGVGGNSYCGQSSICINQTAESAAQLWSSVDDIHHTKAS
jgi:hypothetical protein